MDITQITVKFAEQRDCGVNMLEGRNRYKNNNNKFPTFQWFESSFSRIFNV